MLSEIMGSCVGGFAQPPPRGGDARERAADSSSDKNFIQFAREGPGSRNMERYIDDVQNNALRISTLFAINRKSKTGANPVFDFRRPMVSTPMLSVGNPTKAIYTEQLFL